MSRPVYWDGVDLVVRDTSTYPSVETVVSGGGGGVADGTYGDVVVSGAGTVWTVTIPQSQVTGLTAALAAKVPDTRTISTTAPLSGGGDLSANRTLSVATFTGAGTTGVVPDSTSATGRFLRDDGSWATVSGGGATTGTATLDFGATPSVRASVDVTTGIGAGDMAWATLMYEASADHNAEEHALLAGYVHLTAYRAALNTLRIQARSDVRLRGALKVRWAYQA